MRPKERDTICWREEKKKKEFAISRFSFVYYHRRRFDAATAPTEEISAFTSSSCIFWSPASILFRFICIESRQNVSSITQPSPPLAVCEFGILLSVGVNSGPACKPVRSVRHNNSNGTLWRVARDCPCLNFEISSFDDCVLKAC